MHKYCRINMNYTKKGQSNACCSVFLKHNGFRFYGSTHLGISVLYYISVKMVWFTCNFVGPGSVGYGIGRMKQLLFGGLLCIMDYCFFQVCH
jgi:hypothetical protein